jgi:hypothetical protein
MQRSFLIRGFAWVCIGLVVNLCTPGTGPAQETAPEAGPRSDEPDTTGMELEGAPDPADTTRTEFETWKPNEQIFPYEVTADTLSQTEILATRSVYREWWLWTVAVVVVATTVILYSGGKDEQGEQDLPDFPDPPER